MIYDSYLIQLHNIVYTYIFMSNDVTMYDDVMVKAVNNFRPNKRLLPAHNSRRWRTRRSCPMCTNDQLGLCLWVFTGNQLGLAIFKKNDRGLSVHQIVDRCSRHEDVEQPF